MSKLRRNRGFLRCPYEMWRYICPYLVYITGHFAWQSYSQAYTVYRQVTHGEWSRAMGHPGISRYLDPA